MATPHQARTSHFPLKYSRLRPKGSIDEADVNSDKKRAAWLEALSNDPDADFVVSWGAPSGPCNCATTAPVKPPFEEVLRIKHEPFFAKQDTSRIELWRKRGSFDLPWIKVASGYVWYETFQIAMLKTALY
jgi:hypothetical protein